MRLSDGTRIEDWARKKPERAAEPSLLAALAELRAVLDALPNSREELERIVGEARRLLAEVQARMVVAEGHARRAEGADGDARAALEESARLRREVSAALTRLESWVPPSPVDVSGFAGRSDVEAVAAAVEEQGRLGSAALAAWRDEASRALEEFRKSVDHRFKGVMTVAPPASAIKVKSSGAKVGERKAINFIPGDNIDLDVRDNGSGEGQVDVTIDGAPSLGIDGPVGAYLRPQGLISGNAALTLNRLYAICLDLSDKRGLDQLLAYVGVAAGAGGVIRMGVYDDTGERFPGALLAETATIDSTGTGAKTGSITQQNRKGRVWLSLVAQVAAPSCQRYTHGPWVATSNAVNSVGAGMAAYYIDSVTGALPATWTGTAAEAVSLTNVPAIAARRAA